MKNQKALKEAIRLMINEITVGDVRSALKAAQKTKNIERAKAAAKEAGKKGISAALNLIPGVGTVKDAIEAGLELKDLYDAVKDVDPKEKKKNPLWDLLTIDPDTSEIVDDGVESKFVKDLSTNVAARSDTEEMPDADTMLTAWLKNKYSGTHIKK